MTIAAIISLVIFVLLSLFQAALAFGSPIGRFAWGGKHKVLPRNLRVGSISAIAIYAVFSVFVLSKAGIVSIITDQTILNAGLWIISAYFMIGVVMNGISRSKPERYTMTPVALILTVCLVVLASS